MATQESREDAPARRTLRRARGGGGSSGFSSGSMVRSESLRDQAPETDEVDDAIDPDQIARNIRAGGMPMPMPSAPDDESIGMRQSMFEVAAAGSSSYAKEFRLNLLHRLLMRKVPLNQIAQQLGVSISTIEKDRVELKRRLREAALQLDINELIGGQNAFYDEIQASALRLASVNTTPVPMKLASMRTALAANADRARFLNAAGVFDVLRFRQADSGQGTTDVQMLMAQTAELLQTLLTDGGQESRPAARRSGFKAMSFDDPDASSSTNEVDVI